MHRSNAALATIGPDGAYSFVSLDRVENNFRNPLNCCFGAIPSLLVRDGDVVCGCDDSSFGEGVLDILDLWHDFHKLDAEYLLFSSERVNGAISLSSISNTSNFVGEGIGG